MHGELHTRYKEQINSSQCFVIVSFTLENNEQHTYDIYILNYIQHV